MDLLLAHQGGWDEAAVLLGPVLVFLVLRYMGRQDPDEDAADAPRPVDDGADGPSGPDQPTV